jgi:hypothetical protein
VSRNKRAGGGIRFFLPQLWLAVMALNAAKLATDETPKPLWRRSRRMVRP